MKILHLQAQRPGFTGSGIYLRSMVNLAAEKGYTQAVICGIPAGDIISFDCEVQPEIYPVIFESAKLPFPVAGMSDVMPYRSTCYRDFDDTMLYQWQNAFSEAIKRAIGEFKPDLILSHHLWLLSALARQIAPDINLYAICHGTGLRQLQFCPHLKPLIIPHLKKIDKIFALSSAQKDDIATMLEIKKENITISGNGYNDKIFFPAQTPRDKVINIVYAGKISYAKGLKELFSALQIVYRSEKEFHFTICGSGSSIETDNIKEIATNCQFSQKFEGNVSQHKLAEIFRDSDIFILPSYYEGLPLVLIEALASGLQIIVNELPGIKEWLGTDIIDSGLVSFVKMPQLINTDQPVPEEIPAYTAELAKTIKTRLTTQNIPKPISAKQLEKFSWNAVFNRLGIENLNREKKKKRE